MRALLKTTVVVGAMLLAFSSSAAFAGSIRSNTSGKTTKELPGGPTISFLKNGVGPQSNVTDLCDAAAAYLTGNAFCMRADGTAQPGGGFQTFTTSGSGSQTKSYCRNGINCSSKLTQTFSGSGSHYLTGSSTTSPSGSFTACALFRAQTATVNGTLVEKDSGSGSNRSFNLLAINNTIDFYWFRNSDVFSSDVTKAGIVPGAWHLGCGTYSYVGDGTSTATAWLDGVAGTPNTAAPGPIKLNAQPFTVAGPFLSLQGDIAGAFYTESVLTAAQLQAITVNVLGSLKLDRGNGSTLTTTRGSAKTCANKAVTELTVLPNNAPCTSENGFRPEAASTNFAIRSEEFDSVSWAKTLVTVTADQITGPDGFTTADKIAATSSALADVIYVDAETGAQTRTVSAWFKAGTQGTTASLGFLTDGVQSACVNVTLTSAWQRVQVSATSTPAVGIGWAVFPAANCLSGSATNGDNIYAWGIQGEVKTYATSYIHTLGTSVTRVADTPVATTPTNWNKLEVYPVDNATYALWHFDEATGGSNLVDVGPNGFTLTQNSSPATATGVIAGARTFDGTSGGDYFTKAGAAGPAAFWVGEWSIETWIKPSSLAHDLVIFGYQPLNGYTPGDATATVLVQLVVFTTGRIRIYWQWVSGGVTQAAATDNTTGTLITTGAWYQLAFNKISEGGGTYKTEMYINGQLVKSQTGNHNAEGGSTSQWFMGTQHASSAVGMVGQMDETRVSNRPRTAAEILTSYQQIHGRAKITVTPTWTAPAASARLWYAFDATTTGINVVTLNTAAYQGTAFNAGTSTTITSTPAWAVGTAYRSQLNWASGNMILYRNGSSTSSNTTGLVNLPELIPASIDIGNEHIGGGGQCDCDLKDFTVNP